MLQLILSGLLLAFFSARVQGWLVFTPAKTCLFLNVIVFVWLCILYSAARPNFPLPAQKKKKRENSYGITLTQGKWLTGLMTNWHWFINTRSLLWKAGMYINIQEIPYLFVFSLLWMSVSVGIILPASFFSNQYWKTKRLQWLPMVDSLS